MSEMIERVARASFKCWRDRMDELNLHMDKGRRFEDMNENELEFAYMNARAMIEAMREPTDEMIQAGYINEGSSGVDKDYIKEVYELMIDAALKE